MLEVYGMKKTIIKRIFRLMLALVLGIFVSAFSSGVALSSGMATAYAAEDNVVVEEEQVALAESAEDGGGAMILLMGGMLIIILAVVITVVASFVVTAPIADEI
jgi:hypothetical protein